MLYKEKYFIYYGSRHGLIFNDRSARGPRALSFNGVICTVTSMPSMNFRSLIRKYSLVGLRCTLVPISSHPPPGPSTSPESSASLVLDVCVGRQQPRDKISQGAKNRKEKKRAQINPIPNNGTSGAPDQSYSQKERGLPGRARHPMAALQLGVPSRSSTTKGSLKRRPSPFRRWANTRIGCPSPPMQRP